ncbi:hypothetical protein [Akkermansia glycaniphila]|uniref:Uncharacterized protein n=1 Tax=Akkermansia glycaniphila TaxID=1679444 RepID=A0A1C7PF57_9BACT|nr:hypothetical protein [Akkermansia glycaniphila]OCA02314.1 hypothetical protein AC781_10810 [Akkermansia glycaniphila]OCA04200.1 hypothetical protein AC781_00460 [Akkermansia glycaniphila]SEH87565.1 Hypothetical protein PYTT_1381 [Akkermansia glycaniphila]
MIVQDIPRFRANYTAELRPTGHLHEGKFGKFTASGEIALATSSSDIFGIISEPDSQLAQICGNTTGATLIPYTFGGVVDVQLGANPGVISKGITKLKLNSDSTVSAATGASGEIIVAMAMQNVTAQTAGQLVSAIMLPPSTKP